LNRSINKIGRCFSLAVFAILTSATVVSAEESRPQQTSKSAVPTRAEVDNLLVQVRSKMAAGQLTDADAILRRAESAEIHYPVLHFGDTPAKVRRELESLSRKQGTDVGGLPLRNPLAALLPKSKPATVDPFVGTGQSATKLAPAPQPRLTHNLAPVNLALPQSEAQPSPRELSDRALLAARQALAVGDADRALRLLENAELQHVAYLPTEESPERLAQAIGDIEQLLAHQDNSPSWRQAYAKFLVAQASALVRWGDFDTAERTAHEAAALSADLGPEEISPADILGRIERLRTVATTSAIERANPRRVIVDENVQPAQFQSETGSGSTPADLLGFPQVNSPHLEVAKTEGTTATDAVPVDLTLPVANVGQQLLPRLAQVIDSQPSPLPVPTELLPQTNDPYALLEEGERALRAGDRNLALRQFRLAYQRRDQLDLESQRQLQGHLQMLSSNQASARPRPMGQTLLNSATNGQSVVARQLSADIGRSQSEASQLRTTDPKAALELLENSLALVAKSKV